MGLAAFNRMRRQKAAQQEQRKTEDKPARTAQGLDSTQEPQQAEKPRRKRAPREE